MWARSWWGTKDRWVRPGQASGCARGAARITVCRPLHPGYQLAPPNTTLPRPLPTQPCRRTHVGAGCHDLAVGQQDGGGVVQARLDGHGQAAGGRPLERLGVVDHGLAVQEAACKSLEGRWVGGSARGCAAGAGEQSDRQFCGWNSYELWAGKESDVGATLPRVCLCSPSRSALLQRALGHL